MVDAPGRARLRQGRLVITQADGRRGDLMIGAARAGTAVGGTASPRTRECSAARVEAFDGLGIYQVWWLWHRFRGAPATG